MFRRLFKFVLILTLFAGGSTVWGPFVFGAGTELTSEQRREWLRLLHFKGSRSEVESAGFFAAPDGRTNPVHEFQFELEAFADPKRAAEPHGTFRQPLACAFPARRAFLEQVQGHPFPSIACKDFEEWSGGIQAHSASLVFSSAYAGNPASMFGHTLLRLNREGESDLMSYGANFSAAVPEHENPVAYAMKGLLGAYTGRYDLAPYYRKVNEYNVSESRDLWEYDLSLTPEETNLLVKHLWELYSDGFFPYYFLDENCSYQILTALEAVRPDWDLSGGFSVYALPAETVKRLVRQPGAVKRVQLRPSLERLMLARRAALNEDERTQADAIVHAAVRGEPIPASDAASADAAIAVLQYRKQNGRVDAKMLRPVLLARSRLPATESVTLPDDLMEQRPDASHGPTWLAFGGGRYGSTDGNSASVGQFSFYAFRHDLLDETPSYNPFSDLRVLGATVAYTPPATGFGHTFLLREVEPLAMQYLTPFRAPDYRFSWKVGTAYERPVDRGFASPPVWKVSGGYFGVGSSFFGDRALVVVMPTGDAEVGSAFAKGYRVGAGADFGVYLHPKGKLSALVEASARYDVFRSSRDDIWYTHARAGAAYAFDPIWQLRFTAERAHREKAELLELAVRY